MSRQFYLFSFIGLLFAFIGGYVALSSIQNTPATTSTSAFFSQQWRNTAGKTENLTQWKGQILVLNFWASWCAPCVEEMPELSALQEKWGNQPIKIIGIGVDSLENIQHFQKQYRIQFPLYAAGMDGIDIARSLGNKTMGLPFTAIISPKGNIVKTYSGRLKMEQLQRDIAELTAAPQ